MIIDSLQVIITCGPSIQIHASKNMRVPKRKLPKDPCGTKDKMFAVPEDLPFIKPSGPIYDTSESVTISEHASLPVSVLNKGHTRNYPRYATAKGKVSLANVPSSPFVASASECRGSGSTTPLTPAKEPGAHPKQANPQNQGERLDTRKLKPQKAEEMYEVLPFDQEDSASMSIRSSYQASSRAIQTPEGSMDKGKDKEKEQATPRMSLTTKPKSAADASKNRTKWSPNAVSQDSVLTYVTSALWPDLNVNKELGNVVRATKAEREGVFRADIVLFGVRFIVGLGEHEIDEQAKTEERIAQDEDDFGSDQEESDDDMKEKNEVGELHQEIRHPTGEDLGLYDADDGISGTDMRR